MTDLADRWAPADPTTNQPADTGTDRRHDMETQMDTLTDPSVAQGDTGTADAAQRAKVEELQRRRAARTSTDRSVGSAARVDATPARPQGRTAQGSKIATAGFGLATMLGLVAAMGYASTTSASESPPPAETAPPAQVVVVIHPASGSTPTAAVPGMPGVVAATPTQPIALSAQPVVRQAPASQAPVGQTNGSR